MLALASSWGGFFFARCCLGKVPGGAPFSQPHKGIGSITRTGQLMRLFFFLLGAAWVRSPGRAPFSQLSQQATACTIRMQIVKQINKNELDTRKRKNQLGQLISK